MSNARTPGPRNAVDDEPETISTWLAELPKVTPVTGPRPSLGSGRNDPPPSTEATTAETFAPADALATTTIVAGLPGARATPRSRHGMPRGSTAAGPARPPPAAG